jgi:hypothetical protein
MVKSMPLFTSLDEHAVSDATMFGYFYNSISKYKNIPNIYINVLEVFL